MQGHGQAVGGHHVKAHAWTNHDALATGRLVLAVGMLEDPVLAGDIQIMGTRIQAGGNHRRSGSGKRPGAVEHQLHVGQGRRSSARVGQIKLTHRQTGFGANAMNIQAAPSQNRLQPQAFGLQGNQASGVTVGAVNKPMFHAQNSLLQGCQARAWARTWRMASRRYFSTAVAAA